MMKKLLWLALVLVIGFLIGYSITTTSQKNEDHTRDNLISEIVKMGEQAKAWYRTPAMDGGGGYTEELPMETVYMIAEFIDPESKYGVIETDNGIYTLTLDGWELIIDGRGKGEKVIQSSGSIILNAGEEGKVAIKSVSEVHK